jgi:ADP-ribose pyrophosphatase
MQSKIIQDEVVYEGSICRVHRVRLRMDDGQVVPRDLVEMSDAVVVVPVLPDGRLAMIRNERFAVGEELLEFPAGKLDSANEDPGKAAARELAEETGYTAGKIEKLGGFYTAPGAVTEFITAWLATELRLGRQALEQYERIKVHPVAPAELADLIRGGEVHDAKSISAWALWQLRGGK